MASRVQRRTPPNLADGLLVRVRRPRGGGRQIHLGQSRLVVRTLYFDEADMMLATDRKIRRRSTFFPSSRLRILTISQRAPP